MTRAKSTNERKKGRARRSLTATVLTAGLAVIAGAVFVMTFDANRYRPMIEQKFLEAVGCPIRIGHMGLGWRNGLTVECEGVSLLGGGIWPPAPVLQLESFSAKMRVAPLFRRRIEISSLVFRGPRLHLTRYQDGRLNVIGLGPIAAPVAVAKEIAAPSPAVPITIDSLRIVNGALHVDDAHSTPPYRLTLTRVNVRLQPIASGVPVNVELDGALASDAPNLHLSARVRWPDATQPGSVEQLNIALDRVPLARIVPEVLANEPHLEGQLSLEAHGVISTLDPLQISHAVAASGRLSLTEGKIVHLNVLREVFQRLSMLPRLNERLKTALPRASLQRLEASDTVIGPIEFPWTIRQGVLEVDNLRVDAEELELSGTGWVGFPGAMRFHGILRLDPGLSQALIAGVNELDRLTGAEGRLEFPLSIRGQFPRVAILPDLDVIATKLLISRVQGILGNILQQTLE